MAASPATEPVPPLARSPLERRWPLLTAVLALHLIADFLIALVVEPEGDDDQIGVILGALFGQITLLAVWTAWAPVSFFLRAASGLALVGAVALTLTGLIARDGGGGADGAVVIFGSILFLQWCATQTPLWIARVGAGRRIVSASAGEFGSSSKELQFGLSQLLGLTACVAVVLGAARWLVTPDVVDELQSEWLFTLSLVGLFAAFNTLAPLPTIWAALGRRSPLWLEPAAVYLAGVTVAEALAFDAVIPGPDRTVFAWVNGTLFCVVAGTLLTFRSCGFRLAERSRPK